MPGFYTDALVRSLHRRPQPYHHLQDGTIVDPDTLEPIAAPEAVTYSRDLYGPLLARFGERVASLTAFGLDNNATVLVVGCGFGFLIETLIAAGITDVWGIEPGPYFWDAANDAEWGPGIRARVANDWIGSGTEQASLDALPGVPNNERFGWIVDEDAAPMHSDAELPAFVAGLEARLQGNARGRIIHLVTTMGPGGPGDSAVNWKTLAEWKAVEPAHRWFDIATGAEG